MTEPQRHRISQNLVACAMTFIGMGSIATSASDSEIKAAVPPGHREAALEQTSDETQPAGDADFDTGTSQTPASLPQTEAEFEAEVARLMGESEAFRDAVGSIQVFDQVPEHFVRAEPVQRTRLCPSGGCVWSAGAVA